MQTTKQDLAAAIADADAANAITAAAYSAAIRAYLAANNPLCPAAAERFAARYAAYRAADDKRAAAFAALFR